MVPVEQRDWTLRPASIDDVDALALVGAATFLESFAGTLEGAAIIAHCRLQHRPETYRRYLDAGSKAWLIEAREGQAPVGYALVAAPELPGALSDGSDVELKRIYTLSRFHGGGAGAALLQCAVDHARERQARRLLLGVYKGNDRARAFYAKHGFVEIGERRFRVGGREYDDAVLAKAVA